MEINMETIVIGIFAVSFLIATIIEMFDTLTGGK